MFMNRRDLLQGGLAACAFPLVGAEASAAQAPAPISPYALVWDSRYPSCAALGRAASHKGLRSRPILGDVTRLWYEELYHEWRQGPAALAGMTTYGALFCLEQLGRDAGLHLVLQIEHRHIGTASTEHCIALPGACASRALPLAGAASGWHDTAAACVLGCATPASRQDRVSFTLHSAGVSAGDPAHLVSWVLAPVGRSVSFTRQS